MNDKIIGKDNQKAKKPCIIITWVQILTKNKGAYNGHYNYNRSQNASKYLRFSFSSYSFILNFIRFVSYEEFNNKSKRQINQPRQQTDERILNLKAYFKIFFTSLIRTPEKRRNPKILAEKRSALASLDIEGEQNAKILISTWELY